ncbi:MAG: hypothetical protein NC548_42035 [Lachnospiraceae bacterium]|nr:hypothetical protein [Lachnospiraceae bacterium]
MNWRFWKDWLCKADKFETLTLEDFDGSRNQKSARIFLAIARKYAGNFAMIPANLDIDRLIERFPLTNYKFWKKRGADDIYSKEGTKFDKDRLAYIIGLISSIPASNKDSISEDGFVPIYSKYIQKFFPDYKCYLDYLIRTGVIISNGSYTIGKKSIGYKFSPAYENAGLVKYVYHRNFKVTEKPSSGIPEQTYNKDTNKLEDNPLTKMPYLSQWYMGRKLTISTNAGKYAWQVKERKFAAGYSSWDDNHDRWDEKHKRYFKKYPRSQYNAAMHNIAAIETGAYNAKVDSNVHRLHSAITNMQKDYRNFLRYDGKELIAIDISNSQPFLLCILFNPAFWDKNSDAYINIGHLPENIQGMFPPSLLSEIRRYVTSIPAIKLQNYIREASAGNLYESMQREINNPTISKDRIKTMILITFFSDNRFMHQMTEDAGLKRRFRALFPEVYRLIALCKRSRKNRFACLLQAVESEIILHRCCKRIWDEGEHKVPVFTIHDSIATTEENVKFVKNIMDEELYKAAGVHPNFKEETWSETNI